MPRRHPHRRRATFLSRALPTHSLSAEPLESRLLLALDVHLLADVNSTPLSIGAQNLQAVNDTLFFAGNDGTSGLELWKSDGTSSGTARVKDISPGVDSSFPQALTNIGGTLYFSASEESSGAELWTSDGTSTGTVLVADIWPGSNGSYPTVLTQVGDTFFFVANNGTNGTELWKSDGTCSGTSFVRDIRPGTFSSYPAGLTNVSGTLYFSANDGTSGSELWKSDGTSSGTVRVADIWPGFTRSYLGNLTNFGGTLYFTANDGTNGLELWKSDGTSSGTVPVADIRPGPNGSFPGYLTTVGGTLYFTANVGTNGHELWKSDGTSSGTVRVRDIHPGTSSSSPRYLTNVSGTLYFWANDGTNGFELWKSDGSSSGTSLVRDIRPGSSNSYPSHLTNVGGTLFFTANDGTSGNELWKSDGTSSGTVRVADIRPGSPTSSPQSLTNVGGALFFTANDGVHGVEPWIVRRVLPTAVAGPPAGYTVQAGESLPLDGSASSTPVEGASLVSYDWDLNGDDDFTDATGVSPNLTWAQLLALGLGDGSATHQVRLRVGDNQGDFATSEAIPLTIHSFPPTAHPGGPYTVGEGGSLALDASASMPAPERTIISYAWDLNDDGLFTDAAGVNPTLSWSQLVELGLDDGPASHPVRVRVTDNQEDFATSDPVTLTINPTPPSAGITGPATGNVGQSLTFQFTASDPSPGDLLDPVRFRIDWDSDGVADQFADRSGNTTFVSHSFSVPGNYTISVRARDRDLTYGPQSAWTVTISGNALPDIEVRGGVISIPAGDTTPTVSDGTDFAYATLLDESSYVTHTFAIANTGGAPLDLSGGIDITGATGDYTIVQTPALTVGPGDSTTFSIRFTPLATGLRFGGVVIHSNDPDEAPYTFSLWGRGLFPDNLPLFAASTTISTSSFDAALAPRPPAKSMVFINPLSSSRDDRTTHAAVTDAALQDELAWLSLRAADELIPPRERKK